MKRHHTVIGWLVTWMGTRMAKRKIKQKRQQIAENKAKIGAAGVIALVLVGGVVAAKAGSSSDS
jgi:heme A synthase